MCKNKIFIEVAYATPSHQCIKPLQVPEGCTIAEAIALSNLEKEFPGLDLTAPKVGVFSRPRALTDVVKAGERIEIYRPLTIDPKEARRAKAKKQK